MRAKKEPSPDVDGCWDHKKEQQGCCRKRWVGFVRYHIGIIGMCTSDCGGVARKETYEKNIRTKFEMLWLGGAHSAQ